MPHKGLLRRLLPRTDAATQGLCATQPQGCQAAHGRQLYSAQGLPKTAKIYKKSQPGPQQIFKARPYH